MLCLYTSGKIVSTSQLASAPTHFLRNIHQVVVASDHEVHHIGPANMILYDEPAMHKGNGFGRRECGSWRCLRTFASFSPRAPANRTSPIVFCSCSGNRDHRLECDSNTIEWARFKQQIPSGSIWMIGYVSLNSLFLCGRIEKIRNWEETGKKRLNAVQSSIATSGAD